MTTSGEKYIVYTEQGSKNNPGGINSRKIQNKVIPHFENIEKLLLEILYAFLKHMYQNAQIIQLMVAFFYKHCDIQPVLCGIVIGL